LNAYTFDETASELLVRNTHCNESYDYFIILIIILILNIIHVSIVILMPYEKLKFLNHLKC